MLSEASPFCCSQLALTRLELQVLPGSDKLLRATLLKRWKRGQLHGLYQKMEQWTSALDVLAQQTDKRCEKERDPALAACLNNPALVKVIIWEGKKPECRLNYYRHVGWVYNFKQAFLWLRTQIPKSYITIGKNVLIMFLHLFYELIWLCCFGEMYVLPSKRLCMFCK